MILIRLITTEEHLASLRRAYKGGKQCPKCAGHLFYLSDLARCTQAQNDPGILLCRNNHYFKASEGALVEYTSKYYIAVINDNRPLLVMLRDKILKKNSSRRLVVKS